MVDITAQDENNLLKIAMRQEKTTILITKIYQFCMETNENYHFGVFSVICGLWFCGLS